MQRPPSLMVFVVSAQLVWMQLHMVQMVSQSDFVLPSSICILIGNQLQGHPSDLDLHDIEDQFTYARRNFIFHNALSLESGSTDQLEIIQNFIKERSEEIKQENQLHAIWYFLLSLCTAS